MNKSYKKYIITSVIGLAMAFVVMFIQDIFKQSNAKDVIEILTNAFFVPGILLICFGLLIMSSNEGTFDMLIYGTSKFLDLFRSQQTKKMRKSFYDYRTTRHAEKTPFLHMVLIGIVYLAISLIFLLIWYNLK